jgi:pSer/pThr/pTyr-binding forkhead associated (FHA) protein
MDDDDSLVPCIEVLDGRSRGKLFALERVRAYVVGRMPEADIRIDDPGVSRRHVRLTRREDGSVEVADMRSTNGLIINDQKVERAGLREGDQITLGPDAVLCLRYFEPGELRRRSERAPPAPASAEPADDEHDDETSAVIVRPPAKDNLLSPRQIEVSRLVAEGLTNAAIAERLGVSPRTVTSHLDHIYARLDIGSRAALTRWIIERGLG